MDILTTCCVLSKRTAKNFTHITLFDANIESLKNLKNVLNVVTQACKRPTGVMIQMLFTGGTYSRVKWSRNQIITKTISAWRKRSANFLRLSLTSLFKAKKNLYWKVSKWAMYTKFCSLYHRQQNIMIRLYIK